MFESLMENLAIRDGWGFQKNLATNPRKKPDVIIPSSLTPAHCEHESRPLKNSLGHEV
jgi:hypothetical protein